MKGYYKNWYQHYLEVEAQKELDMKRGYYSNLATKKEERQRNNSEDLQEEMNQILTIKTLEHTGKKRKKRPLLAIFLPAFILVGFVLLWYQMDVGPTRQLVNEALVFARVREPAIDVIGYHTSLLDQHLEFAEQIAAYITAEGELDFADLELMFNDLRQKHLQVAEISGENYSQVIKLWSDELNNTEQLLNELSTEGDVGQAYEQFLTYQQENLALILAKLELNE